MTAKREVGASEISGIASLKPNNSREESIIAGVKTERDGSTRNGEPSPTGAAAKTFAASPQTARLSSFLQGRRIGDYLALTKPEISFLVVLSSIAGFALGLDGPPDLALLLVTVIGVALTSAGSGTLNHYLERAQDGSMKRTAGRPVPAGRIRAENARNFGIVLTGAGLAILCPLVNPLTAVLAALTVALYLFVYTPMKRSTAMNTLVGAIPGAIPALGGYTAATNSLLGGSAWILFALLAFWQMPHFLSLAWMYRKDYDRGGFAMLPVSDDSGSRTAALILIFTIATVATSLLLALAEDMSWPYLATAVIAALVMARPAVTFARTRSNVDARRVLKASVVYIPAIVFAILIDRLF